MKRRRRRGTRGKWSPTKINKVNLMFGGKCAYCGIISQELTVDHIVPVCKGGSNKLSNVYPCCAACNRLKDNLSLDKFRSKIADMLTCSVPNVTINWETNFKIPVIFYFEKINTNGTEPS